LIEGAKAYSKTVTSINDFKKPRTWSDDEKTYKASKKKQHRRKGLKPKNFKLLYSKTSTELQAILSIGSITGVRPVEWDSIKFKSNNRI